MAHIAIQEGEVYRSAARFQLSPDLDILNRRVTFTRDRSTVVGRVAIERHVVQVVDIHEDREHVLAQDPANRNVRTVLGVPLLREGEPVGVIILLRRLVQPFTDKQIALVTTFADQAVIAIENTRLITETREALEQQTATAEVLQVINSSPGELAPVFDAILEKAHGLCAVAHGSLQLYDGDKFRAVAAHGLSTAFADRVRQGYSPGPNHPSQRLLAGARYAHVDAAEINEPLARAAFELSGIRTTLFIPLRKEERLLGQIVAQRREVRPFTDKEIALLENFATQAVIAMENARLITETREALERQTATAEVLQVINSSPGDLAPVFDAILEKAHSLCAVAHGSLQLYDGEKFRAVAVHGLSEALADRLRQGFIPGANMPTRRLLEGTRFAHVADLAEIDDPISHAAFELSGIRTVLCIPLRKDDTLLGQIVASRREVKPFTEKEIALLESFAAQAVIAIENARLLDEVRHRNDELAEALEFQTATGEVLRIVASSPDYLQPVFDAMLEKATELCEAKFGVLLLYDGKAFTVVADRNLPPAYVEAVRGKPFSAETNTALRHLIESKAPVHIRDVVGDAAYTGREPLRTATVELGGVRSLVAVPLLKKGEVIGSFAIYRDEPGGFAENQIALVTTFADQAVIAIENTRLFEELRDRTADLARSVDELTATSDVLKIISRSTVELKTVLDTLGPVDKPNPDPNGCKDDKGREALNEFIVAGCDAS